MTSLPPHVMFGAAYYHEYQRTPALESDLDLMTRAGFTVIRVGESVWSTWEPDDGVFVLEWLQPVLDGARDRGIDVILGTPTYAVPPWLARRYPEIAGERATGQRIGWGARQEADISHPAFRHHAERVTRRILERYADHPAVIGFQVDNEPGNEVLHNEGVFQRFVDHLRRQYGDVDTLNEEWGLVYWSHRLSSWSDLWRPDGNAQPQYTLAWRAFQAQIVTEYIAWQATIVREYSRPEQFVTTCVSFERPGVDDVALTKSLDVTSANAYYLMQDGLATPGDLAAEQTWNTRGTWALYQTADRMFASRQSPFLVTETNAGAIGFSWMNQPAYDGQWRQAAWALISRGAQMIEYWHWHTLHFGAETWWGGVLPHNGKPGRTYAELSALGAELRRAGSAVVGLQPEADVAMVWSQPSRWMLEHYPTLDDGAGGPDRRSFNGYLDPFYRGAVESGLQVRLLHDAQITDAGLEDLVRDHPVMVASGLYVADDALLERLGRYAELGGHLVLGPRSAVLDELGRARSADLPARLGPACGVWLEECSNLASPVSLRAADDAPFGLPEGAAAQRWAEGLRIVDADVLVSYLHPHLQQFAAVTTRRHGAGRITVVGTVPDAALAEALLRWAVPEPRSQWRTDNPAVTVTGARNEAGATLRFLHNWSWEPASVTAPVAARDLLAGTPLRKGQSVQLGPWDVRVLQEG